MSETENKSESDGKTTAKPGSVLKKPVVPGKPATKPAPGGCAPSFLTREKNEMDKTCGVVQPDQNEEYVQKDEEKEAGGEG